MSSKDAKISYEELYHTIVSDLEKALECPILMVTMTQPVVLLSGRSAEKSAVELLVKDKRKDPLDPSKMCKEVWDNYLARDLIEILTKNKEKLSQYKNEVIPQSQIYVDVVKE